MLFCRQPRVRECPRLRRVEATDDQKSQVQRKVGSADNGQPRLQGESRLCTRWAHTGRTVFSVYNYAPSFRVVCTGICINFVDVQRLLFMKSSPTNAGSGKPWNYPGCGSPGFWQEVKICCTVH